MFRGTKFTFVYVAMPKRLSFSLERFQGRFQFQLLKRKLCVKFDFGPKYEFSLHIEVGHISFFKTRNSLHVHTWKPIKFMF